MAHSTAVPKPRLSIASLAQDAYRAMASFDRSITFEPRLRELVKIRASQINGCAFCIDMHTHEARRAGESDRRMLALAAWRESPLFTERERIALAVTDTLTNVSDAGLPDDLYVQALGEFGEPELAQMITAINSWNRNAVSSGIQFEPPSAETL